MIELNFNALKSVSENLFYFQLNNFDIQHGVVFNKEKYPMPISVREMIAEPVVSPDRPIKQFDYSGYTKGVKDGYNRPITSPLDVVLDFYNNAIVPAYFVSDGVCEYRQAENYGFEVGRLFSAWEMISYEPEKYGKEFNKMIDDYNSQFNTFVDLLNDQGKELIDKIKPLLVDAGGMRVANLLYCMEEMNLLKFRMDERIKNKVYQNIRNEFNLDFSDESANKQMRAINGYNTKSDRKTNLIQKDFQFIKNAIK